ncbi:MAG TPA: alpha/beta hydrolase [Streptosporangiaceae bacterium]|nr:alpha/beta hydrolase [Streptosporangiaceae bacterium]
MSMAERDVCLDDVTLRIAEAGTGQRPLLLVHGFTGAKEDFTDWLDQLAALGWHAVAPDLRGHGGSSQPARESAYSFELMADDCLRLADALGWDSFVLLGHSMGGMIAQFMALAAADRLAGLVLMDTSSGPMANLDPDLVNAAVTIVRTEGMDRLAQILAEVDGPLITPAHRRLLAERPGYAEFGDRKLRGASPAMYAAMAPVFMTVEDRLEKLTPLVASLPVLVIVGELDQPFIGPARRMTATLGHGTLAIISGAGHCPQFENSAEWWTALTTYLAALPA